MLKPYLSCMFVAIFVVFSGSTFAENQSSELELKRLKAMISFINAEIRSDLDQILVLQEAMKANNQVSLEEQGRSPDPIGYEDMAIAKRIAINRETVLNAEFSAVMAQTAALRAEKQTLVERVMVLGMTPSSSSEIMANSPK